jgi:hypothetical protein
LKTIPLGPYARALRKVIQEIQKYILLFCLDEAHDMCVMCIEYTFGAYNENQHRDSTNSTPSPKSTYG